MGEEWTAESMQAMLGESKDGGGVSAKWTANTLPNGDVVSHSLSFDVRASGHHMTVQAFHYSPMRQQVILRPADLPAKERGPSWHLTRLCVSLKKHPEGAHCHFFERNPFGVLKDTEQRPDLPCDAEAIDVLLESFQAENRIVNVLVLGRLFGGE